MENSTIISLQQKIGLLRFMPNVLSKKKHDYPNFLSAMYLMALNKLKQRIFKLKCVSVEYFEDLLLKDSYKSDFMGDIKSCALLSVNSSAVLSVFCKSWITVRENEDGESITLSEVPSKLNKKDQKNYLIQCYVVSSIREDFALYVTNEKYFNILQYLQIPMTLIPHISVKVEKCEAKGHPEIAKNITFGYIDDGAQVELHALKNIVENYFERQKHLKRNEVFQISVKETLPSSVFLLGDENNEYIYFKVLDITGQSKGIDTRDDFGFFVIKRETFISLPVEVESFVPPIYMKYVRGKSEIGYEISLCPGGLDKYYSKLQTVFELYLNGGGSQFRPMILLLGSRGSGKKTVLRCVVSQFGLKLLTVNCFDFIGLEGSALDSKVFSLTMKLKKSSPSVLLMENVELLGRNDHYNECVSAVDIFQKHIYKLFEVCSKYPVIIVASSSRKPPELIPSIERMFIETVSFERPNKEETLCLLTWLVQEVGGICLPEILKTVAQKVNGYNFSDVAKLVRIALKFQREDNTLSEDAGLLLKMDHFDHGISMMEALYSDAIGAAKVPSVHWDDVGGLEDLKEEITRALNFSTNYPELVGSGLRLSGFLFYGPPGTGKTLMAKAIATEFNYNFLSVKGPELINMYVGQSEKNVREVFQRAREAAPCVIFFDELDSLAPNRGNSSGLVTDRIVSQLLTEMDGLQSNNGIFIIGATNRPDLVDTALLRPGRFDKTFYVGVCESDRTKLSVIKALTKRFLLDDVDLQEIVQKLPMHVTGADIYSICSNAWLGAAHRCIQNMDKGGEMKLPLLVTPDDFKEALRNFVPSLTPQLVQHYEKFRNL